VKEVAVLPPPGPEEVQQTLAGRTAEVEERIRQTYARTLESSFRTGLAIVAVGGFGRSELFPHSDIDLLLLSESDRNLPPRQNISAFLQGLWDSGLRPSHSVHSVADCVIEHDGNAEFTISLLDRRFLTGDAALYELLQDKFRQFQAKRGLALARQIAGLAEGRRAKYQNTIYHLEPNVKETPGALRDLQTTRWLLMLEPREGTPDLSAAFHFLAGVRLRLHELAGRDQNALSFDAQESLSEHPAALMREYYRQARVVDQAVKHAIEVATEVVGSPSGERRLHLRADDREHGQRRHDLDRAPAGAQERADHDGSIQRFSVPGLQATL